MTQIACRLKVTRPQGSLLQIPQHSQNDRYSNRVPAVSAVARGLLQLYMDVCFLLLILLSFVMEENGGPFPQSGPTLAPLTISA